MLSELNKSRYRALELLAEHVRSPSKELSINAIISDISDEDLRWVTEKIHYYLLSSSSKSLRYPLVLYLLDKIFQREALLFL